MVKKFGYLILIAIALFMASGCALVSTAISAGVAYGLYQATK